jgi:hypothetical protein
VVSSRPENSPAAPGPLGEAGEGNSKNMFDPNIRKISPGKQRQVSAAIFIVISI